MKKLALAALSFVVAYGLLEGVVSLALDPQDVQPLDVQQQPLDAVDVKTARESAGLGFKDPNASLHPYLGFVYTPLEAREGEAAPSLAISREGFLSEGTVLRSRGDDRLVIGLTGGSVAGQLGSYYEPLVIEALRAYPELRDVELDLVWLGMPGYHQPQQVIQLSYLLAQGGEFDVFVNVDGFNEIAVGPVLNVPTGTHPLFPMNWSMVALDVPDIAVRRTVGAIDYLTRERRQRALGFQDSPWAWSPLAKHLRERDDERLARQLVQYEQELQDMQPDEVPWFVSGPQDDHGSIEELMPESVATWEQCSRQLDALCRLNGIRYVHVLQPNQYDLGSKTLTAAELEMAYDAEGPYRPAVELGYPMLREAGARLVESGVEFHDLSTLYADVDETVYSDVCCHYNQEGNRLLAMGIAGAVKSALAQ